MANLHRLVPYIIVGLVFLLTSVHVHAFPQPSASIYQLVGYSSYYHTSSCSASCSSYVSLNFSGGYSGAYNGTTCTMTKPSGVTVDIGIYCTLVSSTSTVPANSSCSSGSCTCNNGYLLGSDGASCVQSTAPPDQNAACVAKGAASSNAISVGGTFNPIVTPVCVGGCAYQATDGRSFLNAAGQTVTLSTIQGVVSAGACSGVTGNIPAVTSNLGVTPDSCVANGQGFISNGTTTVCVQSGTGQTTVNTASGVPPAPNVPSVDPSQASNAASSVQAASGAANGSAAAVAAGVSAAMQQQAFCIQNPTSMICNSGHFAGTCSSAPACEGDAVFCAMAVASFQSQCDLQAVASAVAVNPSDSTVSTFNGVRAGSDVGITGNPAAVGNRSVISMSTLLPVSPSAVFSRSGLVDEDIGTGSAYAVHIPFSNLNTPLTWLGNLGFALCLLSALFIIFV